MQLRPDGFDVWVFRRQPEGGVRYLLLRASQQKAERWFGGGVFWQIPSDFVSDEPATGAIARELDRFGLEPSAIWAAEHTYTIYNRRYEDIVHLAVFAAEVRNADVRLDAGHDEFRWCDAEEAARLVTFRGLLDGLRSVRHYITERDVELRELRLA